jgi:SOS-response transcriptional repressor LexA
MPRAQTNPMSNDSRSRFTPRQGQYLAFIHAYTLVIGRPPAEANMQRFFRVSGPAVHQMVVGLEKSGLISRQPSVPRSIRLLVEREALPELRSNHEQPVKTSVQEY